MADLFGEDIATQGLLPGFEEDPQYENGRELTQNEKIIISLFQQIAQTNSDFYILSEAAQLNMIKEYSETFGIEDNIILQVLRRYCNTPLFNYNSQDKYSNEG